MKRLLMVMGTALALASSLAVAQGYGRGTMGGQGMMGGPGMMGGGYAPGGALAALNLTDEQREKVFAIHEEGRKKSWAVMGEVRAEQFKLRNLYRGEKLDPDKIAEQQKKVDELRRQMVKSRVETHNQVAAVLTPDQRKQLRQFGPWWLGDAEEKVRSDPLPASIEHRIAELRARYPRITFCRAALGHWAKGGESRHALRFDIRWPQHQTLLSGPPCSSAERAVEAGFERAGHRLEETNA